MHIEGVSLKSLQNKILSIYYINWSETKIGIIGIFGQYHTRISLTRSDDDISSTHAYPELYLHSLFN